MNGKTLKVAKNNLEFGARDRIVNVFGCFKYKTTGNIYVIYTDVDTKYPIIYYGSAHAKAPIILSMQCKNESEQEIIKEYIYKVINHEPLENFEMFSLENMNSIEIIASNKIEVKPEAIISLVDITIPQKEETEELNYKKTDSITTSKKKNSKKKNSKLLLIILLLLIGVLAGLIYIKSLSPNDLITKKIICKKDYQHNTLVANVKEENTYNFNNQDSLKNINSVIIYQFKESDYQDFMLKGTYYKYLPDDDKLEGYKQDNENHTFKVITNEEVSTSYNKPTAYEEVLTYYKSEGYTCTEEIAK